MSAYTSSFFIYCTLPFFAVLALFAKKIDTPRHIFLLSSYIYIWKIFKKLLDTVNAEGRSICRTDFLTKDSSPKTAAFFVAFSQPSVYKSTLYGSKEKKHMD